MKPGEHQRSKQRCQHLYIYAGRSTTVHNLLFCAHTLCMSYVTSTFCSSVLSKQLLFFVLCTFKAKKANNTLQQRNWSSFIIIPHYYYKIIKLLVACTTWPAFVLGVPGLITWYTPTYHVMHHFATAEEPRYNEGPSDWKNMFAITRFRYIGRDSFPYILLLLRQGISFVVPKTLLCRSSLNRVSTVLLF